MLQDSGATKKNFGAHFFAHDWKTAIRYPAFDDPARVVELGNRLDEVTPPP